MTLAAACGRGAVWVWMPVALVACIGCAKMSETVKDPSVGLNGGFEHTRSGLPVNWLVYSPQTIPTGSYELIFDKDDFKEGKQSLNFLVHECSRTGGWYSPGIAQEYPAEAGEYLISFWIKNEGCDYTVRVGGVTAKTGKNEVAAKLNEAHAWKHIEHAFTMPEQYDRIRFELSIRSPGTLWIDDVKIERIDRE